MASSQKQNYFLSIDGLRLIASVNIVLFHIEYVGGFTDMGGSPGWFFTLIKGPFFHASIFFLLGGFIFTSKFSSNYKTFKTGPFLLKRFRELYPLHCITTLSMVLLEIIKGTISGHIEVFRLFYSTLLHLTFLWPIIPMNSFTLNSPSWALDAFFLCYLLFGLLLRFVCALSTTKQVLVSLFCCIAINIIWNLIYGIFRTDADYLYFHMFPPARVFEFLSGMLLARLFQLKVQFTISKLTTHILSDGFLYISGILIFVILGRQLAATPAVTFFSYHVILPCFFMGILFITAFQKGIIANILAFPIIRKIGRSSFYPYLLHIPVMSWITFIAEHYFHYKTLLHDPINVWVFMLLLYGSSTLYVIYVKKRV